MHGPIFDLLEDNRIFGFLGDYIALKDDTYDLSVTTKLYSFSLKMTVKGTSVTVEQGEPSHKCVPGITWKFDKWEQPTVTSAKPATRIILKEPKFTQTKSNERCEEHKMLGLGCTKSYGMLKIESDPSGAEIWIDGEKMDDKTTTTISVPYCKNRVKEAVTQVLLRMSDRLNCAKEIRVEQVEKTIRCEMPKP
jgi:hypothetical protein